MAQMALQPRTWQNHQTSRILLKPQRWGSTSNYSNLGPIKTAVSDVNGFQRYWEAEMRACVFAPLLSQEDTDDWVGRQLHDHRSMADQHSMSLCQVPSCLISGPRESVPLSCWCAGVFVPLLHKQVCSLWLCMLFQTERECVCVFVTSCHRWWSVSKKVIWPGVFVFPFITRVWKSNHQSTKVSVQGERIV